MNLNSFPMLLTPFERYMLADDRAQYPMTFVMQFDFYGTIDRRCWEAALVDAIKRHPLLTSLVANQRSWHWTQRSPSITWLTDDAPSVSERGEQIDLAKEIGLRVWTRDHEGHVRLTTQFHHACCDGIGALQFIGDWFAAYHGRVIGRDGELVPLEFDQLTQRGRSRWKVDASRPVSRWKAMKSTVAEACKFAVRRIIALPGTERDGEVRFPGLQHHTFSAEVTQRLRQKSRDANVNLNDLLLCDLFLTLAKQCDASGQSRKWVQINMPTNLRAREDDKMPAANVIGYAFLNRKLRDCESESALLDGIAQETAAIRRWNLGQFFLDGLSRVQSIPGALSWFVSPRSCCATSVFSNLGDPTRRFHRRLPRQNGKLTIGDLTLDKFLAIPPLRPLTRAAFLATLYAGELTIIMRSDDRTVDADTSHDWLAQFVDRLLQSADKVDSGKSVN